MDKNQEETKKLNNVIKSNDIKGTDQVSLSEIKVEEKHKKGIYIGALIIIIAGIVTGYFLSSSKSGSKGIGSIGIIESKKIVGSEDTKIYKDTTEGTLEEGGIDGIGTHKLIRPGGESQTVYLTSSVINLDDFIGKQVKVWGETQATHKAGWFMDVGRLETQ